MKIYKVYVSLPEHYYRYILLVVSETYDIDNQVKQWATKNNLQNETIVIDYTCQMTQEIPFAIEFYGHSSF